jgi:hypothetical protein
MPHGLPLHVQGQVLPRAIQLAHPTGLAAGVMPMPAQRESSTSLSIPVFDTSITMMFLYVVKSSEDCSLQVQGRRSDYVLALLVFIASLPCL